MLLVDVHAHLDLLKDTKTAIANAKNAGVKIIITAGVDTNTNLYALQTSSTYDIVKATMGYYPDQIDKDDMSLIEKNSKNIVGIGECGLDFHITQDKEKHKKQIELFIKHIALANKYKLPLIIHSRKAEQETLAILEQYKAKKVILHCFEGSKKLIQQAIKLGYYLTITTNINRSDQVQTKAKLTPLKQLLTETDAPYMGPNKEIENEPANIKQAIEVLAKIKNIDVNECANLIYMNYQKIF